MIFLGCMFSADRGLWADSGPDRALARQMFGLTEEEARHPNLCFEELSQGCGWWQIIVSAVVFPQRLLCCYLREEPNSTQP